MILKISIVVMFFCAATVARSAELEHKVMCTGKTDSRGKLMQGETIRLLDVSNMKETKELYIKKMNAMVKKMSKVPDSKAEIKAYLDEHTALKEQIDKIEYDYTDKVSLSIQNGVLNVRLKQKTGDVNFAIIDGKSFSLDDGSSTKNIICRKFDMNEL